MDAPVTHYLRKQDVEAVMALFGETSIRTPMLQRRWDNFKRIMAEIEEGDYIKIHY